MAAARVLPAANHPEGNVNRYFTNSARTDLIGQDIWTKVIFDPLTKENLELENVPPEAGS